MRLKNDGEGGCNHNKKCDYNSEYDHDAVITLPMNYPNTGFTYFSPPPATGSSPTPTLMPMSRPTLPPPLDLPSSFLIRGGCRGGEK